MCTLSWHLRPEGYGLFFNRDEKHTRARALPPAYSSRLDAILPIDPDGGGTWVALHRSGAALCLLNGYQAEDLQRPRLSRGELIPSLLTTLPHIAEALAAMDLTAFASFTLCHFPAELACDREQVHLYHWDGRALQHTLGKDPLSSSSVDTAPVLHSREQLFRDPRFAHLPNAERLHQIHHSHLPQQGAHSVCMHREDAQTVSQCLLETLDIFEETSFTYLDGAPCQTPTATRTYFPQANPLPNQATLGPTR